MNRLCGASEAPAPSLAQLRRVLRIGTRRSRLSLWQANHVADLLRALEPGIRIEIRAFSTRGDANPSAPLPELAGKGLFTSALEEKLREGEIDCAAHSLKDMPVESAADLALAAVPKRGDHRDALVSRSGATLADLPSGARIGTGSLRRRAQLLALRPDLEILPIRGNVPTRLDKLRADDSPYDALCLAAVGLIRLGLAGQISQIFDDDQLLCAAGQGALAIQCLKADAPLAILGRLNDPQSEAATLAERAFLGELAAGCAVPVAAHASFQADLLQMRGRVASEDGRQVINVSGQIAMGAAQERSGALELGKRLASQALAKGADGLLSSHLEDAQRTAEG